MREARRGKGAGKGGSPGSRGGEGAADIGKLRRGRRVVQAGQRPKRGAGQGAAPPEGRGGEGGGKGRPATGPASQQPPGVEAKVVEEEEKEVAVEVAEVEAEEKQKW